MQPKKLEHYKYFQPIAWTICIAFAGYVGMLALKLNASIQNIGDYSTSHEERLQNIEQKIGISPENI